VSGFDVMMFREDRNGNWNINGRMSIPLPDLTVEDKSVMVRSDAGVQVNVKVEPSEIATAAGIEEADIRSTLTVEQLENHVMDIAVAKVCAKIGVELNVV